MPRLRRFSLALASLVLSAGLLAGCGGNGVNCGLEFCTVKIDRGVDASTNVLGVDVKLVNVKGTAVTLDIGGNTFTVPVGGESEGVRVKEVTADQVVVEISTGVVS